MPPNGQQDSENEKLRRLSELYIVIMKAPFGSVKKADLDEYDRLADDYLKGHDSLERAYPDPAQRRVKFDAFIRRRASSILVNLKKDEEPTT